MRAFLLCLFLVSCAGPRVNDDERWEWVKLGPTNPTWDEWNDFLGRPHPTPVGVWIAYDREGVLPPRYHVLTVDASGDPNDQATWTWKHRDVDLVEAPKEHKP